MVNERLQLRSAALCGFCTRLLTARDRWNQFCHVAPVPPAGGSHCQKRCRVVHRDYHLDPHHEAWYCERAASYERGSTATARQHKPTQDTTHHPARTHTRSTQNELVIGVFRYVRTQLTCTSFWCSGGLQGEMCSAPSPPTPTAPGTRARTPLANTCHAARGGGEVCSGHLTTNVADAETTPPSKQARPRDIAPRRGCLRQLLASLRAVSAVTSEAKLELCSVPPFECLTI